MNLKKTLLCFALATSCLQSKSQNQQWAIPPRNYNLNGVPPLTTNLAGPSANTGATNGAYDANGNLLFYVSGVQVYKAGSATSLGHLPNTTSIAGIPGTEIEIVPIPGRENCNNFYVIYKTSGNLCYIEIDYNSSNGNLIAIPALNTILSSTNYPNNILLSSSNRIEGLAVSKLLPSANNRCLFTMTTDDASNPNHGGLVRFTIDGTAVHKAYNLIATNASLGNPNVVGSGYFQWNSNNSNCRQMTLSADQTRLGWGGGITSGGLPSVADQSVFEVKLDPNRDYVVGSFRTYGLTTSGLTPSIDRNVAGFAYDEFDQMYACTQSGIWLCPQYSTTFFNIPGSQQYTWNTTSYYNGSQLQYVPSAQSVVGVATNGRFFAVSGMTFSNFLGSFTSNCTNYYDGTDLGYTLPDQIDGDVIVYPSLTPSVSVTSNSICAGNSIVANVSYTGNTTPNNYYLDINECDVNGNPTVGGYSWSSWFNGVPPSSITYPNTNTLPCGKYYKVGFALQNTNACYNWAPVTSSPIVYVNCNPTPVITGNTVICTNSTTQLCVNATQIGPITVKWLPSTLKGGTHTSCISVSPTANTTYSVTVTNTVTGCAATAITQVTVQNIAPVFALTANQPIDKSYYSIEASSYTYLSPSQDATFGNWFGVEEVAVGSTTPYTAIAGTEVDNTPSWCWSKQGAPVYFDGYKADITGGYASTNTSLPCNSDFGLGAGIGVFLPGHEYLITYATWSNTCPWQAASKTAYIGCQNCRFESEDVISNLTKEDALSIKTIEKSINKLELYPNPSNGNFTVEVSETAPQLLQVFDMTGRIVVSQTINGKATINASALTNGIYNVQISGSNTNTNKRLVIEK